MQRRRFMHPFSALADAVKQALVHFKASARPLAVRVGSCLRHPTRRGIVMALAAAPALLLLYALLLIPFTPGISA